jgi:steroid delta-isomerase
MARDQWQFAKLRPALGVLWLVAVAGTGLLLMLSLPVLPQASGGAERAIRQALLGWMADFNAGRADRVCGLFVPELRYDYRAFPERGFADICTLLRRSLADARRKYAYALDIKEILVAGDMAAVRLTWTLIVTHAGSADTAVTREPGLDIFRRQADGSWKIVRYMAYEE